jgi:hypothetical protein
MFKTDRAPIATLLLAPGILSNVTSHSGCSPFGGASPSGWPPVAGSTVPLWAASAAHPRRLAGAHSGADDDLLNRFNDGDSMPY